MEIATGTDRWSWNPEHRPRSEGEDLASSEAALACVQVFALGGRSGSVDASESGYFAVRGILAKSVTEAARYIANRSLVEEATIPSEDQTEADPRRKRQQGRWIVMRERATDARSAFKWGANRPISPSTAVRFAPRCCCPSAPPGLSEGQKMRHNYDLENPGLIGFHTIGLVQSP